MLFEKQHLITAWVVLDAIMDFKGNFKTDMELNNMDPLEIRKVLLCCDLMNHPSQHWTTKDERILRIFISYVFFQLVHNKEQLDECVYEVDKRAKKEQRQSIMAMDDYIRYRRNFFELTKMVEMLIAKDDAYQILLLDDRRISIV